MRFQAVEINIPEVDMTPMIDIVFQLLTFFMMITNFENLKADERVKLPDDNRAKPPLVGRENDLMLNIGFDRDADGIKTSDALVFYAGNKIPVLKFGPFLQQEKRLYRDLGRKVEDITVVIRADSEVPTGQIQELIKMCQQQTDADTPGFQKFALKAKSGPDPQ
jgi:biopolymer transport protein ExbD